MRLIFVAEFYAYRGDLDLAFQSLERAYAQKDPNLVDIVGEPLFKGMADDPRYKAFLRKSELARITRRAVDVGRNIVSKLPNDA